MTPLLRGSLRDEARSENGMKTTLRVLLVMRGSPSRREPELVYPDPLAFPNGWVHPCEPARTVRTRV